MNLIKNKFKIISHLILTFLIVFLCFESITSLKTESITDDEEEYLEAGQIVTENPLWSKDPRTPFFVYYHPPLTYYIHGIASNLVPFKDLNEKLLNARLSMQIVLVLFAIAIYLVTRRIYGDKAGLFALFLFVFNTEILTHARLITIDFTLAFTIFLTIISFIYFYKKKNIKSILFAGLSLGLALLTKYVSLILIPLFFIGIVAYAIKAKKRELKPLFTKSFFVVVVAILILNLGYLFAGSFTLPKIFLSDLFNNLKNNQISNYILRLFPQPFLVGTDYQYFLSKRGWLSFFLGKTGWGGEPLYFLVAFLIKTPIAFLLLILLFLFVSKKKFEEWFIFASIIYFFVYLSLFNKINIGLRYLLMVYPLFILLISGLTVKLKKNPAVLKIIITLLGIIYVLESTSIYPNYFAYFNELVGGPKNGYKYLADSNIDWKQDYEFAEKFFSNHTNIIVNPEQPVTGWVGVNVNFLDISHNEDFWLRKLNKNPLYNLNYSWLIFYINQEDLEKL